MLCPLRRSSEIEKDVALGENVVGVLQRIRAQTAAIRGRGRTRAGRHRRGGSGLRAALVDRRGGGGRALASGQQKAGKQRG